MGTKITSTCDLCEKLVKTMFDLETIKVKGNEIQICKECIDERLSLNSEEKKEWLIKYIFIVK